MTAQAKQTKGKVEPLHHVLRADVPRLAKSLDTHGTEAQSVLSVLATILDWWEKDDAYQCTVLAPEGGEDQGVCILILDQYEVKRLLLYAPEGETTRFLQCLEETTLISWDSVNMLARIIKRLIDPVEKILEAKGYNLYGGSWNNYLVMSPQDVLDLEEPKLPNNVSLRALTEGDASLMVENWKYAKVDGIPFTRDGIKYNGGIGAVDKDGNLVAWVEWNIFGVVGHLFVLPSHRRLGLAAVLSIRMSKEIAKTGRIVAAEVDPNNVASLNVFKRLGFQYDHINRYREMSRARLPTLTSAGDLFKRILFSDGFSFASWVTVASGCISSFLLDKLRTFNVVMRSLPYFTDFNSFGMLLACDGTGSGRPIKLSYGPSFFCRHHLMFCVADCVCQMVDKLDLASELGGESFNPSIRRKIKCLYEDLTEDPLLHGFLTGHMRSAAVAKLRCFQKEVPEIQPNLT